MRDNQQHRGLERLTALLADPHAAIEQFDQLYLRLISEELVGIARDGYRREGRGAVVLGFFGVDLRHTNGEGVPAYYLSHTRAQSIGAGWPASEIEQEVLSYDPQREFIVCINRAPHPNFYRLRLVDRAA